VSGSQLAGQGRSPAWCGRLVRRVQPGRLPQLLDQRRKRLAVDDLHGVIVHAPRAADAMNRYDVLVMQLGRRLRLVFEALQLLGIEGGRERQDLQGHAAAERNLYGFVNHAHAAPADLANQAVVTQRGFGLDLRGRGCMVQVRRSRVNELQAVQALRQRLADFGIARLEFAPVRFAPRFQELTILFQGPDQTRIIRRHCRAGWSAHGDRHVRPAVFRYVHAESPKERRNCARARAHTFFTLSRVRPMRRATSGKLKPCKCDRTITSR
jgi:hypothetical protein